MEACPGLLEILVEIGVDAQQSSNQLHLGES